MTLTSGVSDVIRIFRHLKQDLGFHEVGFAPVTSSPNQLYSIGQKGMDGMLEQFNMLADEYLEYAVRGEAHGFSNVSDTLAELCQGVNKSHPCGAGLGLLGVGPSGDIAPCHRFVDSDQHALVIFRRALTARNKPIFWSAGTSIRNTIATPAGRGRCARAVATMKRSCGMGTRDIPISTIAIGSANGRISAWKFMARLR